MLWAMVAAISVPLTGTVRRIESIAHGRRARGSELNAAYFADQVHYLRAAEREATMPSLFDALEPELVTESPHCVGHATPMPSPV